MAEQYEGGHDHGGRDLDQVLVKDHDPQDQQTGNDERSHRRPLSDQDNQDKYRNQSERQDRKQRDCPAPGGGDSLTPAGPAGERRDMADRRRSPHDRSPRPRQDQQRDEHRDQTLYGIDDGGQNSVDRSRGAIHIRSTRIT